MAAKYDKGNRTINKEKSDMDLPSIKMIRESLTTILRDNYRRKTIMPPISICDATKSSIPVTSRKTINSSANASISKSLSTAGQKNAVSSGSIPQRSEKRKSIQSGDHTISQSKTFLQKNVTKTAITAVPSDSSQRKFKIPETKSTDKFRCKICEKSFLLRTTLIAHQKIHADSNSNCPHCQRAFEKPIALSRHLRENCTKISVAAKKKLLAKDEQSVELNQTMQRSSDLQLKSKSREPQLRQRITGIYRTPSKAIKCLHCGEKFMDVFLFATHSELHTSEMKSM